MKIVNYPVSTVIGLRPVLNFSLSIESNSYSFAEKEDAEKAAWAAPGVSIVESKLEVAVSEFEYEDN